MPKNPKFFRADEDRDLSDGTSPSPSEWFGQGRKKYNTQSPALSEEDEPATGSGYDGWREFFQGHPREPLWNPLLPSPKREEAIKFRDNASDSRALVYVLENAAEIFEEAGHTDLAAECEQICELLCEV